MLGWPEEDPVLDKHLLPPHGKNPSRPQQVYYYPDMNMSRRPDVSLRPMPHGVESDAAEGAPARDLKWGAAPLYRKVARRPGDKDRERQAPGRQVLGYAGVEMSRRSGEACLRPLQHRFGW